MRQRTLQQEGKFWNTKKMEVKKQMTAENTRSCPLVKAKGTENVRN